MTSTVKMNVSRAPKDKITSSPKKFKKCYVNIKINEYQLTNKAYSMYSCSTTNGGKREII